MKIIYLTAALSIFFVISLFGMSNTHSVLVNGGILSQEEDDGGFSILPNMLDMHHVKFSPEIVDPLLRADVKEHWNKSNDTRGVLFRTLAQASPAQGRSEKEAWWDVISQLRTTDWKKIHTILYGEEPEWTNNQQHESKLGLEAAQELKERLEEFGQIHQKRSISFGTMEKTIERKEICGLTEVPIERYWETEMQQPTGGIRKEAGELFEVFTQTSILKGDDGDKQRLWQFILDQCSIYNGTCEDTYSHLVSDYTLLIPQMITLAKSDLAAQNDITPPTDPQSLMFPDCDSD